MSTPYRFPYQRISEPSSPYFYKFKNMALLKVGLAANNTITKPEAFIDTGSQFCLFYSGYAKYMGIKDFKKVSKDRVIPIQGITGKGSSNCAYFHGVKLIIYKDQRRLKSNNIMVETNVEVGFLEKEFVVGGILGMYGFLDRFLFKSNLQEKYFEIEPFV